MMSHNDTFWEQMFCLDAMVKGNGFGCGLNHRRMCMIDDAERAAFEHVGVLTPRYSATSTWGGDGYGFGVIDFLEDGSSQAVVIGSSMIWAIQNQQRRK